MPQEMTRSMKKSQPFNRKIFAMLLEKAKGERSSKQFAADCGISYVQLHKLELGAQLGAPGLKLITKLANNSAGGIELEDYLLAAGKTSVSEQKPVKNKKTWISSRCMKISPQANKKPSMILWTIFPIIKNNR